MVFIKQIRLYDFLFPLFLKIFFIVQEKQATTKHKIIKVKKEVVYQIVSSN